MVNLYVTNKCKKKKAKNTFTAQNVVFTVQNDMFTEKNLRPRFI